ncbi:MAG: cellulase family glycosylhydrolase [Thermofilaceae archaeon]
MRGKFIVTLVVLITVVAGFIYIYLPRTSEVARMKPFIKVTGISKERVEVFSPVELDFNVTADYENPFDPNEVNISVFLNLPNGEVVEIPAFYYQEYHRSLSSYGERLDPVGRPCWKARFTPTVPGYYTLYAQVRDKWGNTARSETYRFEAVPSQLPGFVRISSENPLTLEFDNGSSVFFVGLNVCWSGSKGTYDYDEWFSALAKSGVNIVRIWMAPWRFGIEWRELGRYDLAEAWRLDYVVKLAERYNIYIIFCLINHGQFSTTTNPQWDDNPYNVRRKGPLSKPEEFWINEEAIELFKKRLRYIIARWGYSPNILAWELWNEVDLTDNYMNMRERVAQWHKEIAKHLKSIDPYKRIVTTSFANPNLDPLIWRLEEIDLVTIHKYGPEGFRNIADNSYELIRKAREEYGKPVILAEFGVDWRWEGEPYYYKDREGVGLHDGLWATLMAGSPSTGMSWWWDNYIHPYGLHHHFKAISEFIKNIDPRKFRYLESEPIAKEGGELCDVVLYPSLGWARPQSNYFVVQLNGRVEGDLTQLSSFIHGMWHSELRNNPRFKVTFPEGGRVVVRINSVPTGGAIAAVYVDGKLAKRLDLPDKDGKNDASANEYGTELKVDVPPGIHEIFLDNLGADWFSIDYINFEKSAYKQATARTYGLTNGTFALLWVKNPEYNWWKIVNNEEIEPLKDVTVVLHGFEDGDYVVEYWNTYNCTIVNVEKLSVSGGELIVHIGDLINDIALKIKRAS